MPTNFPPSISDSSRPFFSANGPQGLRGEDSIVVFPVIPIVPIPCDSDGTNFVYTSNSTPVHIYIGTILQTGWTLAYVSGVNCTGAVNNAVEPRTVSIASVTDVTANLSGYANFTATKAGVVLSFRLYFAKVPKGAIGDAGATGAKGDTGAQGVVGPAGSAGSGLVIIKKNIIVNNSPLIAVSQAADGDGHAELTFGSNHGFLVGDYVHVFGGIYNYQGQVKAVSGPTVLSIPVAYYVTLDPIKLFPMDNLRSVDSSGQTIAFPGILVPGMKVLEWHLVCIANVNSTVTVSMGYAAYPSSPGFLSYFSGLYSQAKGQVISRDRRSEVSMQVGAYPDIFLRFVPSVQWTSAGSDLWGWELHIAYINYDTAGF